MEDYYCFICGEEQESLESFGTYFRFPAQLPDMLIVNIDHPSRAFEQVKYVGNVVGLCAPCQRAVLTLRRAQGH